MKRQAFTLAETLITILVIGVVAAITIPALMTQINEYILNKQRTVFERKFEEGLKQMRVDGKLEQKYSGTENFVNEMKKYFKIAQVCDKDNLSKCFPKNFTYDENVTYQIVYGQKDENGERQSVEDTEAVKLDFVTADLKTNGSISTVTGVKPKYDSNVMGLIFSDGVQMLLTYNPNCIGVTSTDTNGNTKKCFGYFADVNSKKSPNLITRDIITNIQMENLGFEIASVGVVGADTHGCTDATQATGDEKGTYTCDYWLGAKRYCENLPEDGGNWQLVSWGQLQKISKQIYKTANCTYNDCTDGYCKTYDNCTSSIVISTPLWMQLNGDNNSRTWTSWSIEARYMQFQSTNSCTSPAPRLNPNIGALCVR